jgi:hypothetical protein
MSANEFALNLVLNDSLAPHRLLFPRFGLDSSLFADGAFGASIRSKAFRTAPRRSSA